ncbi:MAG: LUD domain-containing protein [Chloroflexi bacterium]|nr:LUD domain-containing protein [Chloroflexota bacterium]
MITNPARDEMLGKVRAALGRTADSSVAPIPPSARVGPRVPHDTSTEIDALLAEIGKLTGVTKRLSQPADLRMALAELVAAEHVKKATLWQTPELQQLCVADTLSELGVEIVSPYADNRAIAECDLGVTGVDAALPETGTLLLRSSAEKVRTVSLVPRIHLAILRPAALRADLHQAFADVKHDHYFVFVTGPSRTADIELTLTIGVHGPKALHVWVMD